MNTVLLGNIVALIGAAIMVSTGFLKTKKQILTVQCFQFVVLSAIERHSRRVHGHHRQRHRHRAQSLLHEKRVHDAVEVVFIAAQLALLFAFNADGWFGLLPAAATCVYTWFLDLKDEVQLKIVIIVTLLCWAVYDFVFKNYVTFAFDFGAVVSNLIGIATLRRAAKPE